MTNISVVRAVAAVPVAVLVMALAAVVLPTVASAEAAAGGGDAVIAFIDSGINPYHEGFRDDSARAQQHPSTYLEGFPADARALHLTLDAPDYATAVEADCELWRSVEPDQLYWVPGTRVVGAISFDVPFYLDGDRPCGDADVILDRGGHGTMVASRGASRDYGACPTCLIVAVQGFSWKSVAWAAEHAGWIDVQSNSWGRGVPVWSVEPGEEPQVDDDLYTWVTRYARNSASPGPYPRHIRELEAAAQRHPVFFSTGNGIANRAGVVGHPTQIDPEHTPSILRVGGHDSGYVTVWHSAPPHVVADACDAWAAHVDSIDTYGPDVAGGTSGASPWAAGGAAWMIQQARAVLGDAGTGSDEAGVLAVGTPPPATTGGPLADGDLTIAELRRLLVLTATERPAGQREDAEPCSPASIQALNSALPVRWTDVPGEFPEHHLIGYGAVDDVSMALAAQVLQGEATAPDRPEVDEYFARDAELRRRQHEVYREDHPVDRIR